MTQQQYYIIDFDSTFISVESLDLLAEIVLKDNPDKQRIIDQIKALTNAGMNGEVSFTESLEQRLALLTIHKKHLEILVQQVKKTITPSIKRNKTFFKQYAKNIYIISGGFHEYIYPIVKPFGIAEDHVFANKFLYDDEDTIVGYDLKTPVAQAENNKAHLVASLNLDGKIHVIGDGMTDMAIKQANSADYFYAFTENVARKPVVQQADQQIETFDELLYKLNLPRSIYFPKNKIKVLLLENIHPIGAKLFSDESYHVEIVSQALSEKELIEKIADVSILGIRSKTRITTRVLEHAKKLLAIGAYCIGTNQMDLSACTEKGIAVFNAPYSNTRSVAELIMGEIIVLSRKLIEKNNTLHNGIWDKSAKECHEIRGKKLGIIGYGHIGSQLSILAEHLGMDVYFYNTSDKLAYGNVHKCNSMAEVLKIADIITLHVDGKPENKNLIGDKQFALMKQGVLFLNASRDFVVDMEALIKYIDNGKITGCAIDVFPNEPNSNGDVFRSPLQGKQNVILTPHIGSGTEEGQENIGVFVTEKILQFINAGNTSMSVNFPNLQLPQQRHMHRFLHVHKNVSGVLAKINKILADNHCNIEGQYLKTNNQIGYVITDVTKGYNETMITDLKHLEETIKFRILY